MTDDDDKRIKALRDIWIALLQRPQDQEFEFLIEVRAYAEAIAWMTKEELLLRERFVAGDY